ncbi:helix-turn-helix domain-containing protein (plasmid) [Streptomyces sp. NBC_00637]|jgi:transcriptional regulator with XRE-family HTH domain|uniref:helix-turn-helix transcriptional regulator n=1 Tax=Streptomyces sp. NBC_00637 TaxID=2903667 RepID=UPI002F909782
MPEGMDTHIGARVKVARIAKGLTQEELAGFLGRTENWMYGVEAGRNPLDRYSLITAIAEHCDVDVVWLLGQPYRLQRNGGNVAHSHIPAMRTSMRRSGLILSGHPGLKPQGIPVPLTDMRAKSRQANVARQNADLPKVATLLPGLIEDLNTALLVCEGNDRAEALRLLVDAARTARMVLNQLGYPDFAWSSAEVAATAATQLDDPLVKAQVAWDRCGALLHQASLPETVAVAEAALSDLETLASARQPTNEALSLRGALHLRCAVAHARGIRTEDAWSRIDAALEDADRLGPEWYDLDAHTVFGRGTVAVHAAEVGVEINEPDAGLSKVRDVSVDDVPSKERQIHYQIDKARALERMNRLPSAVTTLKQAASAAPFYVHADPMARALVRNLAAVGVPSQATVLSSLVRSMELVH